MCPETPQWWQIRAILGLLNFLEWGLTNDLELYKSVMDFIPLSHFSDYGTKTVFDLEAVEEEGPNETAYPKPVLSELGFWALKTSSTFAIDILVIWVLA